jgi:flagellin-like protein
MRKGITPVIAVVLLMLITLSIVGFAYVWFNQTTSDIGSSVTNTTESELAKMNKKIRIESCGVSANTVTIRNTGSQSVDLDSELSYTINGASASPSGCTGSLSANAVDTCTFASVSDGDVVMVSAPGGTHTYTC